MNRQETADLIVTQAAALIKKRIVSWAVKKFVFFAWGPFGPLLSHYAGELAEYIAKDAEMRIFFLYIDLNTDKQGKTWLKAMKAYQEAVNNGTPEKIEATEVELDNAFRDLIMLSS